MMTAMLATGGNPSSVHARGRQARQTVERARAKIATALNCKPQEIIFTSGGTESNNTALRNNRAKSLILSAIEHDSVRAAAAVSGLPVSIVPVDRHGLVDMAALEKMLGESEMPVLVSIMLANNETGVIQPIAAIASLVHEKGGLLHCDAVQAFGKIAVDFRTLGADFMSISAHKLGGPHGVGALVIRESVPGSALIVGGGQELGRRSGTENLAGIAGFGAAVEIAVADLSGYAKLAAFRDRLENEIAVIAPEAQFFGAGVARLANTSCFAVPGLAGETQVMAMDIAGICVSSGSACSSGKVTPSHVIAAMAADGKSLSGSAIRVSLGWQTVAEDIDLLVKAWREHYQRSRTRSTQRAVE